MDKPKGMTSFDVVEHVRKTFGIKKAGHTGTLDPNVTGLMLIALEESRKAMPVLMGLDKEYKGKMLLHGNVNKEAIQRTFRKFTGEIVQKPPVRSRVARVERKRKIHSLNILRIRGREITFEVKCEAGTYIRKLVHDMGVHLGCGAHMIELRRTAIGPFKISQAIKLAKLSERNLIRLEDVLKKIKLKKIVVKDDAVHKIRNGSPVLGNFILKKDRTKNEEIVGIFSKNGDIIALARQMKDKIKTTRVFLF